MSFSSAKYMRISDLPEPDYFELELEKIFHPPPLSRTARLKHWLRRNLALIACAIISLLAVLLYFKAATRVPLVTTGILRAEVVGAPQLELDQQQQQQQVVDLSDSNEEVQQVTVSGSEIVNSDGVDIANTGADDTNVTVAIENGTETVIVDEPDGDEIEFQLPNNGVNGIDSESTSSSSQKSGGNKSNNDELPAAAGAVSTANQTDDNAIVEANPDKNVMLEKPDITTTTNNTTPRPPPPPPRPKPASPPSSPPAAAAADNEPLLPILATFYSSVEGPKSCRGHILATIPLPKPPVPGIPTASQCYNFPRLASSGCATFQANKIDGCIADVFSEPNCKTYMNTAAFMAENRPVGGNWRSVRVQCGLPEPDPETLGKPPMADQISNIVDNDHPT